MITPLAPSAKDHNCKCQPDTHGQAEVGTAVGEPLGVLWTPMDVSASLPQCPEVTYTPSTSRSHIRERSRGSEASEKLSNLFANYFYQTKL